jgi:hypothetical protein
VDAGAFGGDIDVPTEVALNQRSSWPAVADADAFVGGINVPTRRKQTHKSVSKIHETECPTLHPTCKNRENPKNRTRWVHHVVALLELQAIRTTIELGY